MQPAWAQAAGDIVRQLLTESVLLGGAGGRWDTPGVLGLRLFATARSGGDARVVGIEVRLAGAGLHARWSRCWPAWLSGWPRASASKTDLTTRSSTAGARGIGKGSDAYATRSSWLEVASRSCCWSARDSSYRRSTGCAINTRSFAPKACSQSGRSSREQVRRAFAPSGLLRADARACRRTFRASQPRVTRRHPAHAQGRRERPLARRQGQRATANWNANHRQVSPDYFRAMGIRSNRGAPSARRTTRAQRRSPPSTRRWPAPSGRARPLGKRFKVGSPESPEPWTDDRRRRRRRAADGRGRARQSARCTCRTDRLRPTGKTAPYSIFPPRDLVVRTSEEPQSLMPAVRNAFTN